MAVFPQKPHYICALNYFGAILKDFDVWVQAQIAAIVEYFGLCANFPPRFICEDSLQTLPDELK